jgi:hypothetical protein
VVAEYVELCVVDVLVLKAGTIIVGKVELDARICVVGTEETEAMTTDEFEGTGTTDEIEDEVTLAAAEDEVLIAADDVDRNTDELAGVEVNITKAEDAEPEEDALPWPDTLVVRSPPWTYTPLK